MAQKTRSERQADQLYSLSIAISRYDIARQVLIAELTHMHKSGWHTDDMAKKTGLPEKFIRKMLREGRNNAIVSD